MATNGLSGLIQSLNLTGTPEEIVEVLNAKSVTITCSDMVTYATLANRLGPQTVANIDRVLEQADLEWVRITLAGAGIDFSNPKTQETIDQFVASGLIDAELGEQLKAIGIRRISPYEQWAGEGQVVTVEQVEAALTPPEPDGHTVWLTVRLPNTCEVIWEWRKCATRQGAELRGQEQRFAFVGNPPESLTDSQRVLVDAVLRALQSYGG